MTDDMCKPTADEVRRVVKALRGQGFAVVPAEPAEAMIAAAHNDGRWGSVRDIYRAMLAATAFPE